MNAELLRLHDFIISFLGLVLGLPLIVILYVFGFFDTGAPLFFQPRVGRRGQLFTLVKFRTMYLDTISLPTHLVDASRVTKYGNFLRRSKLDELPQLWNVLVGDMSLVGPRPCLPNQVELIVAREKHNLFDVKPGITGLAQLSGIDMSNSEVLAATDAQMMTELSMIKYWKYLFLTCTGWGYGDRVRR